MENTDHVWPWGGKSNLTQKRADAGIVDNKCANRDLRGAPPKELRSFFSSVSWSSIWQTMQATKSQSRGHLSAGLLGVSLGKNTVLMSVWTLDEADMTRFQRYFDECSFWAVIPPALTDWNYRPGNINSPRESRVCCYYSYASFKF